MAGGQSVTSGQGSFGRAVTVALVGSVIAVAAGQIIGASGGQQITSSIGAVSTNNLAALATGPEDFITVGQGTLTPQGSGIVLSGQAVTVAQGLLSASGQPVTVHLSGVEAETFLGQMQPSLAAVGQVTTAAAGTVSSNISTALTGLSITVEQDILDSGIDVGEDTYITSAAGSPGNSRDVALVGSEATLEQGSLVLSDGQDALVGSAATAEAGTAVAALSVELVGQAIAAAQYNVGAPGWASLSGSEVAVIAGSVYLTNDRTFPLVGQSITTETGVTFASPVCFYSGQTITVSQEGIGPRTVALVGLEIDVQQGPLYAEAPRKRGGGGKPTKPPKPGKRVGVEDDEEETLVQVVDAAVDAQAVAIGVPLKKALDRQLDGTILDDTIADDDEGDDLLLLT